MKKLIVCLTALTLLTNVYSQITSIEKKLKPTADTLNGWTNGGMFNLNFSQVSLTNWAGGGVNSIALNGLFNYFANYRDSVQAWQNTLTIGYGVTKQGKAEFFKSDDRIDFTSKYGRKAFKDYYYAGLLNFRSQMFDGFSNPGDTNKISSLLAPGYLLAAAGLDFKPSDDLTMFIAPLTGKITFVMDQTLANAGAFGVDSGKTVRSEFGGYIRLAYSKKDLIKNVNFSTNFDAFSNYMNNPENIDINWETVIGMQVNKYLTATLSTNLIYDDDIDIAVSDASGNLIGSGPRTQFKQVFGAGFTYKF